MVQEIVEGYEEDLKAEFEVDGASRKDINQVSQKRYQQGLFL